jgi:hypothetical protein
MLLATQILMSPRKNFIYQVVHMVLLVTWQHWQNALVLVSEWGCPHIFRTLICNPTWPDIQSQLLDGQTAFDRLDLTAPVFKSRLDATKTNIRNGKNFGG